MPPKSAGLLLYRIALPGPEVLLVHPGGPYYIRRDTGVWSIPKGLFADPEDPLGAARREFREETGQDPPAGNYYPLSPVKMKGGKTIHAWAVMGEIDADRIISNTFRMEYPYKSGRYAEFPEVDRAAWLSLPDAQEKIIPAQAPLLDELLVLLKNKY